MAIRIVPHAPEWKERVETFNRTLREAGSKWGFYVDAQPTWLAQQEADQPVHRSYWLAIEDDTRVVAAFGLKPQAFWINGQRRVVTDWQGPVSLGAVDKKYSALGIRLMREMLKMHPLLFSWGHGGLDEPMIQMLVKMGWHLSHSPIALRILQPKRVFAGFPSLWRDSKKKLAAQALAHSGLAGFGVRLLELAQAPAQLLRRDDDLDVQVVANLDSIADEVWQAAQRDYGAVAERDKRSMRLLLPERDQAEWKNPTRLVIRRRGAIVGWAALLITDMNNDARFGNLRVATLVDYFARARDATSVVAAVTRYAKTRGADLVVANQTHPLWLQAMSQNGFFLVPHKRAFAVSPKLREALADCLPADLFLTNLDGHGPMGL